MLQRTVAGLVLAGCFAMPAAAQESPLMAARELYASARYDEALAVLNGLRPQEGGNTLDLRSVEQYRSLCLLALGRGAEAEEAIGAVVAADPTYQPSEVEASPRVRAAFAEVRQRQLPDIVRSRYQAAKATFDRKQYADAEQQFAAVIRLLDDPDMGGRLGDLRTLAAGFLDLSAAAAAPPPEPKKEEPPQPPPAPPMPPPDYVFAADDEGVIPPTSLRQDVPRVPSHIVGQTRDRGLLEVVIDEQGRVTSLTMRISLHPVFDSMLLSSARDWRYEPATFKGKPVKFRKMVQIAVSRR